MGYLWVTTLESTGNKWMRPQEAAGFSLGLGFPMDSNGNVSRQMQILKESISHAFGTLQEGLQRKLEAACLCLKMLEVEGCLEVEG